MAVSEEPVSIWASSCRSRIKIINKHKTFQLFDTCYGSQHYPYRLVSGAPSTIAQLGCYVSPPMVFDP